MLPQITLVFYFDKDLAHAPRMPDGRSIEDYITEKWPAFSPGIVK